MKTVFLKIAFFSVMLLSAPLALAKTTQAVNDAEIVSTIEKHFTSDETLRHSNVKVSSKDGVVKLEGTVDTDKDASKMVEISQSIPHVKDTDTKHLKIQESNQPMTDAYITAKVKGKFVQEKLFGDKEIPVTNVNVETKNGTVYLTGTVNTKAEAENAAKIARSVEGVKHVDAKINIKSGE